MTTIVPSRPVRPIRVESGGRIPTGGTTGQALVKSSNSNYAVEWGTATASAAWGAISGTLSAQTDLQTALNAKQDTLVSGTTIKTLNGSTILGSGDLAVGAAWGGITGTLSSQTDLITELNNRDTANRNRANHTGTQAAGTITGLATVATSGSASDLGAGTLPAARLPALTGAVTSSAGSAATSLGSFTKAQLDAAVSDGNVLYVGDVTSNATHTGDATGATALTLATVNSNVGSFGSATQVATFTVNAKGLTTAAGNTNIAIPSTQITDFAEAVDDRVAALAVAGANMTITYNDVANTLTFAAAGGGGSPGGSSGQVQFNNAGAFGGAADVEIEGGQLRLDAISSPVAPAAGGVKVFGRSLGGRILPAWVGPSGLDTSIQAALHGNSIAIVLPANAAAPTQIGLALTSSGLTHVQTITSSARWQATRRIRGTSAATAGSSAGMRTNYTQWYRGNAAGFGGFWFRVQFGMNTNLNGGQKFVGLCASTGLLAGEPSALVNMCGCGYDSTDASTGNWQFMRNDGSGTATKVDLGTNAARNTTDGYELIMFMAPNSDVLFVRIENITTGTLVLDTSYNTDVPAANTGLAFKAEARNGAVAAADSIEVAKVYIETDY